MSLRFFSLGGVFTGIVELIIIGISLSMDAFAVSVSNAIAMGKRGGKWLYAAACAVVFGLFQGAMPTIGYALGSGFGDMARRIDHYIALLLLGLIGAKMIAEARHDGEGEDTALLTPALLLVQGLATSVDALAVGISFAALSVNIVKSAGIICIITSIISAAGFILGSKISEKFDRCAQIVGGILLIAVGVKIFLSHML